MDRKEDNFMTKIKKIWSDQSVSDRIGWFLVIVAFLANCYIIFKGTKAFFHSDDATAILFAREQWQQKRIYPEHWNFGTDIWNFGLNTLIIPLLGICSKWLDARAWAVVIQTFFAMVAFGMFKKAGVLGKRVWIVLLAALMPISEVVSEHFYFQATYMTMVIYLAIMILASIVTMSEKKIWRIGGYLLLLLMLVLRIGAGYSMILVFSAPMLVSLAFMAVLEAHKSEKRDINKLKKYCITMLVIVCGTIAGIIYNYYLVKIVGLNISAVGDYGFITYDRIGESIVFMVSCFARLFGAADKSCSLLSIAGINKALAFVYMVFVLIYIPISLFRGFKTMTERQKIFYSFSVISSFGVCYIFVISGMQHARYLLWIYFYSFVNLGMWIDCFKKRNYSFAKEIRVVVMALFVILLTSIYGYYLTYDYEKNEDSLGVNNNFIDGKVDYELIEYLEQRNYTLGYGLYWQSYAYRAASDGRVRMAAIHNNWGGPYLWLNSTKWYEEEGEPCFVLVTEGQYKDMPRVYKDVSYKTEEFHGYKILLYHSMADLKKIWKESEG